MKRRADEAAVFAIRPQLLHLQLWHCCQQVQQGTRTMDFALRHWTGIRTFMAADDALMREVTAALTDLHAIAATPEAFAERASHYLQPHLEHADAHRLPANHAWHGCFRAELAADGVTTNLHFYNACCPESPFADMAARRADLHACLAAITHQHPQIADVRCASWINNLAPFQSLFPSAFCESLTRTDPDGKTGLGWWGQFITKENQLNHHRAAEFKATGVFTYHRLAGVCPLAQLQRH